MAYGDFKLNKVCQTFSLTTNAITDLFSSVSEVVVGEFLRTALERIGPLGMSIGTEKARSEFIIAPILAEAQVLSRNRVSLFSGIEFNVVPEKDLKGVCDFIFSRSSNIYEMTAPVLMVVEAKKEDISAGLGQCAAEMVAARFFNEREATGVTTIFGAVTSGSEWRFLKLESDVIFVDKSLYYLAQVDKILGILLHILQDDQASQARAA
ncbi:MAG TPA: hypothetical protein VFD58_02415 [Blastocatellia bacterium]|nr:hypothetical protein [Blastocatellia bacterium]